MNEKQVSIRYRERNGWCRSSGLRGSWGEYQVVQGRKVIHRTDLRRQAEQWCADNGYTITRKNEARS